MPFGSTRWMRAGCASTPVRGPATPAAERLAPAPARRFGHRPPFARRYSGDLVVDFSSSGYLDVSVPPVPPSRPMRSAGRRPGSPGRVFPFGDPGIEGRVRLPRDYRGLPRPSSAPCAKASAVRPGYLPAPRTCRGARAHKFKPSATGGSPPGASEAPGGPTHLCRRLTSFSSLLQYIDGFRCTPLSGVPIESISSSLSRHRCSVAPRRYAALKVRGVGPRGPDTRAGGGHIEGDAGTPAPQLVVRYVSLSLSGSLLSLERR